MAQTRGARRSGSARSSSARMRPQARTVGAAGSAGHRRSRAPARQSLLDGSEAGRSSGLEDGFGGPQVCDLVGISYRQLDYWARTGLLCPSIAAARGSGTKRSYSYRDLLQLKVIKQLLDSGVSLQSARRAISCLRANLGADLASANLVLTGTRSVLARSDGEVVDLLAGGQGVFNIVPLSGVVEELDADIVRIARRRSAHAARDSGARGAASGRRRSRAAGG